MRAPRPGILVAVLLGLCLAAPVYGDPATPQADDPDLWALIEGEEFRILRGAAERSELREKLRAAGPWTLFAPTDAAFAKLPQGAVDALLHDDERLAHWLSLHLFQGELPAHVWADRVEAPRQSARNGRLYPIDRLIPEYLFSRPGRAPIASRE